MTIFWLLVRIALWALAGFIASQIMKSNLSVVLNIILGCVGGAVGSLIASLIGFRDWNSIAGLIISVGGACLVIYIARLIIPHLNIK